MKLLLTTLSSPLRTLLRYVALPLLMAVLLLPGLGRTQPAPALALQAVTAYPAGNGTVLMLTLSGKAPEPMVFAVGNPPRLSLDLPDVRIAMAERFQRLNIGAVRSIAVAEASGRTRVVVDLASTVSHSLRVEGNKVYVQLTGGAAATAATPVALSPLSAPPAISSIDFRRGEKGEGRILITMGDPQTSVDVSDEGGKVTARFRNTRLPDSLLRRLDVLDFATPVKFIDALRDGIDTRLIVTPVAGGDYEQTAYQSGNLFTIELQPLTAADKDDRRRSEPRYTGERISLSFQNIDVRSLLQIIADVASTNMVVSDSVQGELAMRLQNVPWDQALDIILRTKGLGMRQEGNVMMVAPMAELAERDKVEAEADKQKVQLAPLRSELIQVNYAKASDIAALLRSGDSSVLSERGRVSVDDRTNTLLVLETREKLGEVRSLIAHLDIPVRQVLIESRIVIANNDYSRELGARFGVTALKRNGNGLISTSGTAESNDTTINDFLQNGLPASIGSLDDRFNVSLPAGGSAGSIALALLGSDYLVDLELSAMQAEGRGEVISSPRVITANTKQASIEQGVEIPYQEAASSGATSVSFKKAVLSLTVTPQITPDDRIIMDLSVNKDSVGNSVTTGSGGSIPSIDTRKVTTQVLVENGQTVVLGGIYEQENRNSVSKVPLLGDIPILGAAFRNRITVANKDELLIFVTPKVLRDGLKLN